MFKFQSSSFLASLTGLVLLFTIHSTMALAAETPKLGRKLLLEKQVDLPSKAIDAKVIKVNFPPAFKTQQHTHEGPGPRYVTKGKVKVIEGGNTNIYAAGDVFWETGQLMSVENVGEGEAELIIFELTPPHSQ